jgi:hypothetical protein
MEAQMEWMLSDLIDPALSVLGCMSGWSAGGVLVAGVLAAGAFLFPARAHASGASKGIVKVCRVFSAISGPQLLDIMKRKGLKAEYADSSIPNVIRWKFEGLKTPIIIIGYDGETMMFRLAVAKIPVSDEEHNRWNREYRYSRSFPDYVGDPILEIDLDLQGGVCEGRIVDFIDLCPQIVRVWISEVLFKA